MVAARRASFGPKQRLRSTMIDVLVASGVAAAGFVGILGLAVSLLELNQSLGEVLQVDVALMDFKAHMFNAVSRSFDPPAVGMLCGAAQPLWVGDWCAEGASTAVRALGLPTQKIELIWCLSLQGGNYTVSATANPLGCDSDSRPMSSLRFNINAPMVAP